MNSFLLVASATSSPLTYNDKQVKIVAWPLTPYSCRDVIKQLRHVTQTRSQGQGFWKRGWKPGCDLKELCHGILSRFCRVQKTVKLKEK